MRALLLIRQMSVYLCFAVTTHVAVAQRGIDWTTAASPAGVDVGKLAALYMEMEADAHHDLKGIVVIRDGQLASEHYFNGDSASSLHDIRSATKSITALAMGIAVEQHAVKSVDDSIATYLPGLPHDGKEKIRIQDLLTMRSGLDADDDDPSTAGNEDRLDESADWMHTVYAVPVKRAAGSTYLYCSVNAFLTGAIVENATHAKLDAFVDRNLFQPLGIPQYRWRHVPVDRTTGQGNLEITARDAAAIGQLMLMDGVVNGKRVLSHAWVQQSFASLVPIHDSDPYSDAYGYMWYTRNEPVGNGSIEVHFASGNGGNKIYVVPHLHMVVAITSSAYNTKWGQRRSQDILLRILAASSAAR